MPLFEYRCDDCGAEFEEIVRGDSKPKCPECESSSLKKLISGFAVGGGAQTSTRTSAPVFSGG